MADERWARTGARNKTLLCPLTRRTIFCIHVEHIAYLMLANNVETPYSCDLCFIGFKLMTNEMAPQQSSPAVQTVLVYNIAYRCN